MRIDAARRSVAKSLLVAVVLVGPNSCGRAAFDRSVLARTRGALLQERFTIGRLTGGVWQPCQLPDTTVLVPRSRCPRAVQRESLDVHRFVNLASQLGRLAASDSSVPTLWASALVDLRLRDDSRDALDRAVASLERARAVSPDDPALLNDLAVVYMEIGARDQHLKPMLQGLDAVDGALRRDSTRREARFNRALILERLYLVNGAERAWSEYVAIERDSAWKSEAALHLRLLSHHTDTLTPRQFPQQARDEFFRVMGRWARATRNRNRAAADKQFEIARAMRDSVDALGADRTIPLAMLGVAESRDQPARRDSLAQAFIDLSTGIALHDDAAYEDGERVLGRAERALRQLGSPAARWATYYLAAVEADRGKYTRSDERLRAIVGEATRDESAVVGKALWMRGVIELRLGNYEPANRFYRDARKYFVRAKDAKNEAATAFLLSEGLALAGQSSASFDEGFRGLRELSPFRQSFYLHNHLITVAAFARAAGLRLATIDIVGEALAVNETLKKSDALAFALCTRSRDLAALGDSTGALADLSAATVAAHRLVGHSRKRALTEIDLARGRLERSANPHVAMTLLARAADSFKALETWLFVPSALYELALASRDAGDTTTVRLRLRQAITVIERQRASFQSAESRSAFYDTVESVFDAMIDIELDAGRPDKAFQFLERQRAAVWPQGRGTPLDVGGVPSLERVAHAVPPHGLFVAYAVLGERVAIWSASKGAWRARSVQISRDSLSLLVSRLGTESSKVVAAATDARARLFDLLLAPLATELDGVSDLSIVPDRELTEIPFAALWNSRSGRSVVENYTVRTEPSAAFVLAASALPRPTTPATSALIVGNPDQDAGPGVYLQALRGAALEAKQISDIYPGSRLLSGRTARRSDVIAALPKHSIFHFAGHAVFNGDQPERSYLALTGDESDVNGRLLAREIALMDLSNVRIVVLSACSTLKSRPSRTGSVAGLAYSFLRAGVPATVSTLWDIPDDAVVAVLVEFHRQMERGTAPPEALRLAQLSALTSPHVELHSPAVWAAFIYTGP